MLGKERARKLAKLTKAKARRETGLLLLDTPALVEEGLRRKLVDELFFAEGRGGDIVDEARKAGISCSPSRPEQLEKLADLKTCAGIVALAHQPRPFDLNEALERKPRFVVLCDRIADPGNLGTIARSAAAFGCDLLVLSQDCADPMSSKAMRASAGAFLRLPLAYGLPEPGAPWPMLFRAVAHDGMAIEDVERPKRVALWLGNEAQGPREAAVGVEFENVTIPLDHDTESLNVAAAAAILCHCFR